MADVINSTSAPRYTRRWIVLGVMCLSLVVVVMALSAINVALPARSSRTWTPAPPSCSGSSTPTAWCSPGLLLLTAGAMGPLRAAHRAVGRPGGVRGGRRRRRLRRHREHGDRRAGDPGHGRAFVMPATLSMVTTVFPPHERPRAIATWAGFAGAGGAIGPIMSGLLLEHYWWGSAFIVIVPWWRPR